MTSKLGSSDNAAEVISWKPSGTANWLLVGYSGVPRGGGLGCSNPPPRNSEDIGGVLDRMSKKSRRLDFLLKFAVFSYGCNLLNKGFF